MARSTDEILDDGSSLRRAHIRLIAGIAVSAVILVVSLVMVGGAQLRDVQRRVQCKSYFAQMGLALHNYHGAYASLPPVSLPDASGRPAHSWRVAVLPYINRTDLYDSYRFNEPWNGPRNSKIHSSDVPNFQCPIDRAAMPERARWTSMSAIIGPHTAWPSDGPVQIAGVSDGLSDTIFLAEVHQSGIHWLEPRDLHVRQMSTTVNAAGGQGISSPHSAGAHVLLGDGSVRFLSENSSAEVVQRLIERDDGLPTGDF